MPRGLEKHEKPSAAIKVGVEAVDRAMQILSAFTRREGELELKELASRTGLYKSTLLRLLASLEKARMIQRRPDKVYVLGPESMRLSAVFRHHYNATDRIRPVLQHIAEVTGESSSFMVAHGDQHMMCLVRQNSPQSIRDHALEGDVLFRGKRASGRILCDFENVRGDIISKELLRALPYFHHGENKSDLAGIAAPVFSLENSLAGALSLSGPTNRFSARAVAQYKRIVLDSARRLSDILGGLFQH